MSVTAAPAPLRLAFFTSEFVTEPDCFDGGLAQYLGRLTQALRGHGHAVEVFVHSSEDRQFVSDGIRVHRVRASSKMIERLHRQACRIVRRPMHRFYASTVHQFQIAASLRRAFLDRHREAPFDLAQATNLQLVPLLLGSRRVPVVVRLSSDLRDCDEAYGVRPSRDSSLAYWLGWLGCRRASALCAPSARLAVEVRRRRRLKVQVMRPAFELEEIKWDWSAYDAYCKGGDYLLFHGTIGRLKGIGPLAEALEIALPANPDMRIVFVGKDATMGDGKGSGVELLKRRLGNFVDRVQRLDRLPHSQLYPILSKARGSVLPSLLENLSNAALEAMALSRVVVGTRGASFDELIEDGKSGLLVEIGDAQGLARAIERLWRMPAVEREAMGNAARRVAEEFRPEKSIPVLEEYYREVIGSRRPMRTDPFRSS